MKYFGTKIYGFTPNVISIFIFFNISMYLWYINRFELTFIFSGIAWSILFMYDMFLFIKYDMFMKILNVDKFEQLCIIFKKYFVIIVANSLVCNFLYYINYFISNDKSFQTFNYSSNITFLSAIALCMLSVAILLTEALKKHNYIEVFIKILFVLFLIFYINQIFYSTFYAMIATISFVYAAFKLNILLLKGFKDFKLNMSAFYFTVVFLMLLFRHQNIIIVLLLLLLFTTNKFNGRIRMDFLFIIITFALVGYIFDVYRDNGFNLYRAVIVGDISALIQMICYSFNILILTLNNKTISKIVSKYFEKISEWF